MIWGRSRGPGICLATHGLKLGVDLVQPHKENCGAILDTPSNGISRHLKYGLSGEVAWRETMSNVEIKETVHLGFVSCAGKGDTAWGEHESADDAETNKGTTNLKRKWVMNS